MRLSCDELRARFERALGEKRAVSADPACREHVLSCPSCLELVSREEALEDVLDSLEEPIPPVQLAARVLAALAPARTNVAADGERALDELLERWRAPAVPARLPRRIQQRLAAERPPAPSRRRALPVLACAVLALVLLLAVRGWRGHSPADTRVHVAGTPSAPDSDAPESDAYGELVGYALENWELLTSEDLDLLLGGLDPVDEVLLEFALDDAFVEPVDRGRPPVRRKG